MHKLKLANPNTQASIQTQRRQSIALSVQCTNHHTLVVQRLDNAIDQITHYPVDKY